jgi:tetratricopeptide (TPR) repeat protein
VTLRAIRLLFLNSASSGARVVVVLTSALAICTCSPPTEQQASSSSSRLQSPPAHHALKPVMLPDLSAMSVPVQKQVRDRFELLTRTTEDAAARASDRADAYGELGKLLFAAESYAEAEPCFFNAHALAPADGRWSYYLAHVYRLQGESMKAAEFFERSLEDRPDDVAALIWLGNTYFDQGRLDEADAMFSRGLARRPNAAARFGRGRVALAKHDYARAIEHLEGALTLDRSATVIHYSLAMAYRAAGNLEQAENHLRLRGDAEVRLTDPLIQELEELLHSEVVYERRGDRALARGEFTAAVTHFRKGLDLAPTSLSLRQKLAVALSVSGDLQAAGQELLEVLRRSPEFAPAHYSLGVLLLSNGREDLAIDRFMAAVRYDPTYLQARLQLANALRRRGRLPPALRQYAEVIKMDPRVPEARFGEVLVLVRLKRYQEARKQLIEAVRLHPERPEFTRALARLYAAAPDDRVRDGQRALALAQELVRRQRSADELETMAMALAEAGQYEAAARSLGEAIAAAQELGRIDLAKSMASDLRLYEQHRPLRIPWREDPSWDHP